MPENAYRDELKEAHKDSNFVRPMQCGNGIDLLEVWQPDFDVLGYVVNENR